jgi:hypothetical protein
MEANRSELLRKRGIDRKTGPTTPSDWGALVSSTNQMRRGRIVVDTERFGSFFLTAADKSNLCVMLSQGTSERRQIR